MSTVRGAYQAMPISERATVCAFVIWKPNVARAGRSWEEISAASGPGRWGMYDASAVSPPAPHQVTDFVEILCQIKERGQR